jgi:MEDS: MEthanogen/methylotroph, DcmR Sensory domain
VEFFSDRFDVVDFLAGKHKRSTDQQASRGERAGRASFRFSATLLKIGSELRGAGGEHVSAGFGPGETKVFWGEIAPCEHIAQFYQSDSALIESLACFVAAGLGSGESVIVIATAEHLRELSSRLAEMAVDLQGATSEDRYITLDAEIGLASFMVQNWPDHQRFSQFVEHLIRRAGVKNRRVRVFGEMVALLWARGQVAATVRLEHLWQQFCKTESFSLFCAYPQAGFTKDLTDSFAELCAAHTRVLSEFAA